MSAGSTCCGLYTERARNGLALRCPRWSKSSPGSRCPAHEAPSFCAKGIAMRKREGRKAEVLHLFVLGAQLAGALLDIALKLIG